MKSSKKQGRSPSQYVKQRLAIVDQYIEETGDKTPDLHYVAAWAYRKGLFDPQPHDVIKQFARELSRACRQDFVEDENGEPVRQRHAVTLDRGGKQLTFWFKMEDATRENMRLSAQARRRGSLADVLQIVRDVTYYNRKYNPGDPLQLDFDFNKDIEERQQPTEYPDAPPSEGQ
jgi:hypothetical protein